MINKKDILLLKMLKEERWAIINNAKRGDEKI